jgi:hypothetical protein
MSSCSGGHLAPYSMHTGVKEAGAWSWSSAEVKNEWSSDFTLIIRVYGVNRGNFTCYPLRFKNNILNLGGYNLDL